MRILALDVGEKRIGVARADSDTRIAVPVGFIDVDGSEWEKLVKLTTTHNTMFFVVGLPRSNEGNETAQTVYVRNFAKTLTEKIPGAKVRFQDESLTSVEAEERLKVRGKLMQKGDIDAEAAAIILQDFMETFSESEPKPPEMTNIIERETKKVKRKTKKATKLISGIAIFVIIGLLAGGGALWIREIRRQARAEEYARQEAEMQAEVFDFTIRPGETIYEIQDALIKVGYSAGEVTEAFNAKYDYDFLKDRPEGATLEGYLYGNTHQFYKGTPAKEILANYLEEMGDVIKKNDLEKRYADRGLTLFEGITLASVVQKEASEGDQPTVAQVFFSRLNNGMLLGSDVTVSYAIDTVDPGRQTYSDNQAALAIDSCYNTRVHPGLPCGPISNPGLSALLAVAEPTDTAYLYFLTGDDGLMYYSYTESEHIQNIHDHCQELCNVSL